eukprot:Ihof_evm3s379 gene=Ihof_evmTU3s379
MVRSSPSASESEDEDSTKMKPWHCLKCTFLNTLLDTECEVCLVRRERVKRAFSGTLTENGNKRLKETHTDRDGHSKSKSKKLQQKESSGRRKSEREYSVDIEGDSPSQKTHNKNKERHKHRKNSERNDDTEISPQKVREKHREQPKKSSGRYSSSQSQKELKESSTKTKRPIFPMGLEQEQGVKDKYKDLEKAKDKEIDRKKKEKDSMATISSPIPNKHDGLNSVVVAKGDRDGEKEAKTEKERVKENDWSRDEKSESRTPFMTMNRFANSNDSDSMAGIDQLPSYEQGRYSEREREKERGKEGERDKDHLREKGRESEKGNEKEVGGGSEYSEQRPAHSQGPPPLQAACRPTSSSGLPLPKGVSPFKSLHSPSTPPMDFIALPGSEVEIREGADDDSTVKIGSFRVKIEDLGGEPPTLLMAKRQARSLTLREKIRALSEKKAMEYELALRLSYSECCLALGAYGCYGFYDCGGEMYNDHRLTNPVLETQRLIKQQQPSANPERNGEVKNATDGIPLVKQQIKVESEVNEIVGEGEAKKRLSELTTTTASPGAGSRTCTPLSTTSATTTSRPPPVDLPTLDILRALGGSWVRLREGVFVETHANGGASIVHVYLGEHYIRMSGYARSKYVEACVEEFLQEKEGLPVHTMGIIHGCVKDMPNILRYLVQHHPTTSILMEGLNTSDTTSMTIGQYDDRIDSSYSNGTSHVGPMRKMSLVGTVQTETGGYFKDVISNVMRTNEFVKETLPWGRLSSKYGMAPNQSVDGPTLLVCPGEQEIPSDSVGVVGIKDEPMARPRPHSTPPDVVTDRVGCHIDFYGQAPERFPVASVGIIQSCDRENKAPPIVCKQLVAFNGKDMEEVQKMLQLDFNEDPVNQLHDKAWVDVSKLNHLRRNGITYAQTSLMTGD